MARSRSNSKKSGRLPRATTEVRPAIDGLLESFLRPYQLRWVWDPARFAIAVKSAQIGYSTATAGWAVRRCLEIPQRNIIFLSRSERQALELSQKAKSWLDYFSISVDFLVNLPFAGTSAVQHEIRFGNGSRIIVLAANPDTARGYTGDVVLDEFAFHKDSQAIFTAVYRQVSLGYAMRILSTPNGQQGKFYELAKQLGLDSGVKPENQPVRASSDKWQVTSDKRVDSRQAAGVESRKSKVESADSSLVTRHSSLVTESLVRPLVRHLSGRGGRFAARSRRGPRRLRRRYLAAGILLPVCEPGERVDFAGTVPAMREFGSNDAD